MSSAAPPGEARNVLEPDEPAGEYGAALSSISLMEMFVESLSEKLSSVSRRVRRWTNVGIVTRPTDFDLRANQMK